MTMMFEVEDLKVASPATVSRCGMVYMEPISLGVKPLIYQYKRKIPPLLLETPKFMEKFDTLFNRFCDDSLELLRRKTKEIVATSDGNIIKSFTNNLSCFFDYYFEDETTKRKPEEVELITIGLENIIIFSWIWSIGCTCVNDGRRKFNTLLRAKIKPTPEITIPEEGEVYDYCYDVKTNEWSTWTEPYESFKVDTKLNYGDIVVPTSDYAKMRWLQKFMFSNKKHVLCPGPIGTGKSMNG